MELRRANRLPEERGHSWVEVAELMERAKAFQAGSGAWRVAAPVGSSAGSVISSRSKEAREDAPGFFAPVFGVGDALEFSFDGGQSSQNELKDIGESVLAGDVSRDLVDEKLAERDVDGRGRREIADGGEDIGGDDISSGDAPHFSIEVMMTERIVPGIVGGGAAFAIGTKVLTATAWDGRTHGENCNARN